MYSKISNVLLYSNDVYSDSLIKLMSNDKLILIFDYIYMHTGRNNICQFTIHDMISSSYLKPKSGSGKVNDQFISALQALEELKVLSFNDISFDTITINSFIKCTIKLDLGKNFMMLLDTEKKLIVSSEINNRAKINVLNLYCYLKGMMFNRGNFELYATMQPEVCYPSYDNICNDLNISRGVVKKSIDILVQLNLIRYDNIGLWKPKSGYGKFESPNTYVLYKDGWEDEIAMSFKQYRNAATDRIFLDTRDYMSMTRSENGFINMINRLEIEGKAKQKDIQKRDSLLRDKEERKLVSNDKAMLVHIVKELKDNMLLSDYYEQNNNINMLNKYIVIEDKLGLVDSEDKLHEDVDYDYYKWVVSNYDIKDHDKWVNYVKKHKKKMFSQEDCKLFDSG